MAIIACPECENQISNRARTCPACGHPLAKRTALGFRLLRAIGLGIFGFIALIVLGGVILSALRSSPNRIHKQVVGTWNEMNNTFGDSVTSQQSAVSSAYRAFHAIDVSEANSDYQDEYRQFLSTFDEYHDFYQTLPTESESMRLAGAMVAEQLTGALSKKNKEMFDKLKESTTRLQEIYDEAD